MLVRDVLPGEVASLEEFRAQLAHELVPVDALDILFHEVLCLLGDLLPLQKLRGLVSLDDAQLPLDLNVLQVLRVDALRRLREVLPLLPRAEVVPTQLLPLVVVHAVDLPRVIQ